MPTLECSCYWGTDCLIDPRKLTDCCVRTLKHRISEYPKVGRNKIPFTHDIPTLASSNWSKSIRLHSFCLFIVRSDFFAVFRHRPPNPISDVRAQPGAFHPRTPPAVYRVKQVAMPLVFTSVARLKNFCWQSSSPLGKAQTPPARRIIPFHALLIRRPLN